MLVWCVKSGFAMSVCVLSQAALSQFGVLSQGALCQFVR